MKLLRLDYSQWIGQPQMWEVEDLEFQDINLIVGINATGKTRLLNVINNFARIISGNKDTGTGNFLFEFSDNDDVNYLRTKYNPQ